MKKLLFSLLIFLTVTMGAYSMIETMSLDNLVAEAEVIVLGTVKDIQKTGKSPEGFNDLEILANLVESLDVYKGTVASGEKLTISTLAEFEDSPEFEIGKKYLLFLTKDGDHYRVCNGPQGCWPADGENQFAGMGTGITLEMVNKAIGANTKH